MSNLKSCTEWLYEFRNNLKNDWNAADFAKFAIQYNPQYNKNKYLNTENVYEESFSDYCTNSCPGLVVYDVAQVYSRGHSAIVKCNNVKLNLYKIYLVLTEAKRRLLDCSSFDDKLMPCIDVLLDKFQKFTSISMNLLKNQTNVHVPILYDLPVLTANRLSKSIKSFKIDCNEFRGLIDNYEDDSACYHDTNTVKHLEMIDWEYFKRATCSDIFALLCFSVSTGNFDLFQTVLSSNMMPCLANHICQHSKVVASFIPIATNYHTCNLLIDLVFGLDKDSANLENYCIFMDWIIWRSFCILEYTKCSYFILYKFVGLMYAKLCKMPYNNNEGSSIGFKQRLELIKFLNNLIKQYIIYRSFKGSKLKNISGLDDKISYMNFVEYLELDAAQKLALFFNFSLNTISKPSIDYDKPACHCGDDYIDKNGYYKGCLNCATQPSQQRLNVFFQLINPVYEKSTIESGYVKLNDNFSSYFNSLKLAMNCGLEDYMDGVHLNFSGKLDLSALELFYALASVLCKTQYQSNVDTFILRILYGQHTKFNVLENLFLLRSILSKVEFLNFPIKKLQGKSIDVGDSCLNLLLNLGKLDVVSCNTGDSDLLHSNAKALLKHASKSTNLDYATVKLAIKCQLDFIDVLLNLLSVVKADLSTFSISLKELTRATSKSDSLLTLLQKIIVHLMSLELSGEDFKSCIYALENMSRYIGRIDYQQFQIMLFYTTSCFTNNPSYIKYVLSLWKSASIETLHKIMLFLRSSLDAVNLVLYMQATNCFCFHPLAQVVFKCCRFNSPGLVKSEFVVKPLTDSLHLHLLLQIYLDSVGVDADGNLIKTGGSGPNSGILKQVEKTIDMNVITDNNSIMTTLQWLGALQRCCQVFEDFRIRDRLPILSNKLSDGLKLKKSNSKNELVFDAITSLAKILSQASVSIIEEDCIFHFRCIIEQWLQAPSPDIKMLEMIKNKATDLLPNSYRMEVSALLSSLVYGESAPLHVKFDFLNLLLPIVNCILHVETGDYSNLSKLLSLAVAKTLPDFCFFIYRAIFSLDFTVVSSPSTNEIDIYDLLTGYESINQQCKAPESLNISDAVIALLNPINVARIEVLHCDDRVKVSFDKLANKFSGNVKSSFFSSALEKAESSLSNIAMKKLKIWPKGRSGGFQHYLRGGQNDANDFYLPIVNFFNGGYLQPCNYHFANCFTDITFKWRNQTDNDLAIIMNLDTKLGCQLLMEMCNYSPCEKFLNELKYVISNISIASCIAVLECLQKHLNHLSWHEKYQIALKHICNFLQPFSKFPSMMVGKMFNTSSYRKSALAQVPSFVLENVQLIEVFYKQLDMFIATKKLHPIEDNDLIKVDYVGIHNILFNAPIDKLPNHSYKDQSLGKEFVQAILQAYESVFWECSNDIILNFNKMLAHVLMEPKEMTNCLLKIQARYKKKDQERWLQWRLHVYQLTSLYPNTCDKFNSLYKPNSLEVYRMLKCITEHLPHVDITTVDHFESFKRLLLQEICPINYMMIIDSIRDVDANFALGLLAEMQQDVEEEHSEDEHYFLASRAYLQIEMNLH